MSRRITYSDDFNGEADSGIREILSEPSDDDDGRKMRLKKVLLNVIKNELTSRQSEIIMLYYFKGVNIVEIAQRQGISPQAVSALMKRARMRIFKYMKYYF